MDIEKEVEQIKERNRRVEADKAWETSWTRRLFIAMVTYAAALVWLVWIDEPAAWLKAFVPAVAYFLSTLTLPALRKWWIG